MTAPTIAVTVPATTANLGCAFDCAAIAVSLHLRVGAAPLGSKGADFAVSYRGPNSESIPLDSSNLIVKSMHHYAARAGKQLPAAAIDIDNEIPLGVGLGSSAAAIVAGITLGAALCEATLSASEILRLALEIETHPDNLAAAVHGGMVVSAVSESGEVLVLKIGVAPHLDFVCVIPDVPLPTEKARSVLPAQYSRQDVVANLQRTALIAAAFFSGPGSLGSALQPEMFRDTLHQPYRAPLIPGIDHCLDYRHVGLAGVFLSGAGSAVMAIAKHSPQHIADALVAQFHRSGTNARAVLLKADNHGTQVKRVPHPLPPL